MTKPTPYYEDELVTLYLGDCFEIMPRIDKVDHVIGDPPYDEKTHKGARSSKVRYEEGDQIKFDPIDPAVVAPRITLMARRWVVAFCAMEQLGDYKRSVGDLWVRSGFWRRIDGSPQFSGDRPAQPGEGIAIWRVDATDGGLAIWHVGSGRKEWNGGGKAAYYVAHNVVRGNARVHDTQKPESLMMEIVEDFTKPGETILDPYGGSGTTAVAAKRLGRKCVLIEIDEENCRRSVDRLRQSTMAFFDAPSAEAAGPDLFSILDEETK